jgi:DNA-binding response OmpR family regulator
MIKKILCVDDETDLLEFYQKILEEEGFEVNTAINGIECGCKLVEYKPDLIILDYKMPEMNGEKTLKYLMAGSNQHIKVIVVSGFLDEKDKTFLSSHGVKWLTKPLNSKLLLDMINKVQL